MRIIVSPLVHLCFKNFVFYLNVCFIKLVNSYYENKFVELLLGMKSCKCVLSITTL